MVAKIVIFNNALTLLGKSRVSSPDETSETVTLLNEQYEPALDAALEGHPWNFALKRFALPAAGAAPAWGFAFAYPFPTAPFGLRPWDLEDDTVPWEAEGREILTDAAAPLKCRFIVRIADTTLFTPLFVEAFAAKLAETVALKLANNTTIRDAMEKRFESRLALARSIDGQTGKPKRRERSELLDARL